MTHIYLIRHGQASFGAANYDQLSDKGQAQAHALGRYLKNLLQTKPYIVTGSMQRHQQTAQLALAEFAVEMPMFSCKLWNEFNHHEVLTAYEPKLADANFLGQQLAQCSEPREYLKTIFYPAMQQWSEHNNHDKYQETWLQFKARVQRALDELCTQIQRHQPKEVLVFSSGGVISVVVAHLLGLSAERTFSLNWEIANTSVTMLKWQDEQLKLHSVNEYHFLKDNQADLTTWL